MNVRFAVTFMTRRQESERKALKRGLFLILLGMTGGAQFATEKNAILQKLMMTGKMAFSNEIGLG